MALTPGTRLGPYEITAQIGVGGMGEVYRATDTNLRRQVAIKVLPEAVAGDAERLARFQREAQVLAALNHPNIAAIYGVERSGASIALVMELVEGPTLADRMTQDAIPVDDVLPIAKQMVEALEAAHEQGIIHRDLKPANIKVRLDGTVKVLDFGLARVMEPTGASSAIASMSPTITSPAMMTGVGVILGTAAYMSPEQAAGKAADRRADIWSFGVVLWEMLTGRRLFHGETVSHTLADVLRAPIDLTALPVTTPRVVRDLVRRCLDRDVTMRLRDIGEARIALQNYLANPAGEQAVSAVAPPVRSTSNAAWAIAALALVALGLMAWRDRGARATPRPSLHLAVPLPGNTAPAFIALSPDGRRLVMKQPQPGLLVVYSLETGETRPLKDTSTVRTPFWSPDSRTIAFFQDGALKSVPATGGPLQTLCEETGFGYGGTWSRDGVILFATEAGALKRLTAPGEACAELVPAKPGGRPAAPRFLPDGEHFLYVRNAFNNGALFLGSLADPNGRRLLPDQSGAEFVPDTLGSTRGHLLFLRAGTLMAQSFDTTSLELSGDPIAVAEQVSFTSGAPEIAASSSNDGTVVYITNGQPHRQLVWYDRAGKSLGLVADSGLGTAVSLSPDGKRVAFMRGDGQSATEARLVDLERGLDTRPFVPPLAPAVVWSPDATRFVFSGDVEGTPGIYVRNVGGGSSELLLREDESRPFPSDWSRDGRWIVYTGVDAKTQADIWLMAAPATTSTAKPIPLLRTPANESQGQISPDGRWLAYTSDESGSSQVYVRPFAGAAATPDTTWTVSSAGGLEPRWRADGKELFYLVSISATRRYTLMAVPIAAGQNPFGTPTPLFEFQTAPFATQANLYAYSPAIDGQRFLINVFASQAQPSIDVLLNWPASLLR